MNLIFCYSSCTFPVIPATKVVASAMKRKYILPLSMYRVHYEKTTMDSHLHGNDIIESEPDSDKINYKKIDSKAIMYYPDGILKLYMPCWHINNVNMT